MENKLGFNDGDFRFFKSPQIEGKFKKWDHVEHFNGTSEAINFWNSSEFMEMHQVTRVGNCIHIIPYEY